MMGSRIAAMESKLSSSLAAVLLGLAGAAGCSPVPPPAGAAEAAAQAPIPEFRVAEAAEATWELVLRLTGQLLPFEEAIVAAKVAGRVQSLEVDVGARLKPGETLAVLEARDYELRRDQARASLEAARALLGFAPGSDVAKFDVEQAAMVREAAAVLLQSRREVERQTSLLNQGAATQAAMDVAQTELSAAESRLQVAREAVANRLATIAQREVELAIAEQQLADTRISAPFECVVAERRVGTGDYLSVGTPIVRLQRNQPLRLRLSVPEQAVSRVQLGQELRASFDSGAPAVVARLVRSAPELSAGDRSLSVEADLPNPQYLLRPGSFARAELVLDPAARTLVLPPAALVRFAGVDKVFVVEGESAKERRIVVGRVEAARIEVLGGLNAGDLVVLEPGRLQSGTRIRVRSAD